MADTTTGDPMVMVRVSETYDLSTKVNKMGIVGIHTPRGNLIDQMWPGLVLQHKKFRFVKCDVAMACASLLPADPLQIGVEAGAIAPQDMFNPILYKAVSNDSMSQVLQYIAQVQQTGSGTTDTGLLQGSVASVNNPTFGSDDNITTDIDQFGIYYGLLADSDGWRKAMPQAGLEMRGLYPLVFSVMSQFGTNGYTTGEGVSAGTMDADSLNYQLGMNAASDLSTYRNSLMRGPTMRMPALDTVCYNPNDVSSGDVVPNSNALVHSNVGEVPPAYVGLIVLPPAKLNQLYYRLKVTWTIEFTELRSMNDIAKWVMLGYIGSSSYGTDYANQSQSMPEQTAMVDAGGADIQKVMGGA